MKIRLNVHGVKQILNRICLTLKDPDDSNAWKGNLNHCHTRCTRYIAENHRASNKLVLFGVSKGSTVAHSIVTDANDNVLADAFEKNKPVYDPVGGTYTFTLHGVKRIYHKVYEITHLKLGEYCMNALR
jgi:hypothetical protein